MTSNITQFSSTAMAAISARSRRFSAVLSKPSFAAQASFQSNRRARHTRFLNNSFNKYAVAHRFFSRTLNKTGRFHVAPLLLVTNQMLCTCIHSGSSVASSERTAVAPGESTSGIVLTRGALAILRTFQNDLRNFI